MRGVTLNSRLRAASTARMVCSFAAGLPVSMSEIVSWRTPARPASSVWLRSFFFGRGESNCLFAAAFGPGRSCGLLRTYYALSRIRGQYRIWHIKVDYALLRIRPRSSRQCGERSDPTRGGPFRRPRKTGMPLSIERSAWIAHSSASRRRRKVFAPYLNTPAPRFQLRIGRHCVCTEFKFFVCAPCAPRDQMRYKHVKFALV